MRQIAVDVIQRAVFAGADSQTNLIELTDSKVKAGVFGPLMLAMVVGREYKHMKLTPWMLAIAAFFIIAALAVGFIFKRLFAQEVVRPSAPCRENIPVALSDIEPGTEMQSGFLADAPILTSKINEYRDVVKSRSAIVGRIANQKIPMATPLRLSMFYPINEVPPIQMSPNYRLVSVNVGDSTGMVSGLIKKGSYVDVMMTVDSSVQAGSRRRDAMALQLFDGVRVYEVTKSSSNAGSRNEAVLELTPHQQKIMVLAKEKGRISLTYNPQGPGNGGVSIMASRNDRILLGEILGYEDPVEEKEETPFVTEQYRNGGRQDAFYDKDGNRVSPSRQGNQSPAGGFGNGGVPLQGSGGGNWLSTSNEDYESGQAESKQATNSGLQSVESI